MNSTRKLRSLFVICAVAAAAAAALGTQGCNGFGTTCSTDADCQAKSPGATCDPTLQVCFLYAGPFVQSIAPANGEGGVPAANGQVVAAFSEIIVDSGVKATSFSVVGQGFRPPGHYVITVDSADASVATFKPAAGGLALGTTYAVNLTSDIKDLAGRTLLPFSSTFTTRDGQFIAGNTLLRVGTQTGQFAVGSNYLGNIVTAATYLLPGTASDFGVYAGVSAAGDNPVASYALQSTTGQQANHPSVGIAYDGTAFAGWENASTTGYTVQVGLYDPTVQAWRYVQQLAGPQQKPLFPQVVGFNYGNGAAVWLETVTGKQVVFGSGFRADAGWGTPLAIQTDETLSANPSGTARQVTAAGDFQGNALIAWQSEQPTFDAGPPHILAAFLPVGGLGPPVPLSAADGTSQHPVASLAFNLYGAAYGAVVWETQAAGPVHVFASTLDAARPTPFSPAVQLDNGASAFNPQVGVAANGNAVAIWQEAGGAGYSVVSSVFTRGPDGGWSAPITIDSDAVAFVYAPAIAVDPGGNAIAAWLKAPDAGLLVKGARYTVGAGWHDVSQIGASADPVFNYPVGITVDGLGRGYVVDTRIPTNSLYLEYVPFQ